MASLRFGWGFAASSGVARSVDADEKRVCLDLPG
jgi:hypothetical protein